MTEAHGIVKVGFKQVRDAFVAHFQAAGIFHWLHPLSPMLECLAVQYTHSFGLAFNAHPGYLPAIKRQLVTELFYDYYLSSKNIRSLGRFTIPLLLCTFSSQYLLALKK